LSNVPQHTLPNRTDECQHCGALLWPSEYDKRQKSSSLCCMHGKVDLHRIFPEPAPQPLLKFFRDASDSTAQHFRQHARAYNSSLCMASTGLHTPQHQQPYTMFVQGRVYHSIGPLEERGQDTQVMPQFAQLAQLYIIDPSNPSQQQLEQRLAALAPHATSAGHTHSAAGLPGAAQPVRAPVPPGGSDTT
jgi:hypothetical protein